MAEIVDKIKAEKLQTLRHSMAHVMAEAVLEIFPDAKIAIGPAIENGFYYDFGLSRALKPEDLEDISGRMRKIIGRQSPFEKKIVTKEEAKNIFVGQDFKQELIDDLPAGEEISVYSQGGFTDLCRGPHVESTNKLNAAAFKLLSIAGAYWRGDEKRPMLQRIYGTAWVNPNELKAYLTMLEEAEKRDHRRVGREQDLFHLDEENPGQIFWHPKGWSIYRTIEDYIRLRIRDEGYVEVKTPSIMPKSLWEKSGHWAKYQENMFITESEKRQFALKPMNCPGHIEIFKKGIKSYRDLPLRMAEFGSCTRNEATGSLHGIMRVRGFVQDDAHIFCTEAQISSEVAKFCKLLKSVYLDFGFPEDKIITKFSTRPAVRVGDDETWDRAEAALEASCKEAGLEYELAPGEGAFYGPKLEFTLVDALGRHWQCGTIQVDYQMPSKERLDAAYVDVDGAKHSPVMLHRAILGSLERFIGILIEHFSGAFPVWLNPTQAAVIPVAETFNEYASGIAEVLKKAGIKVNCDLSNDRLNAKIRNAQGEKIPYMLVVGEKEKEAASVAVRLRTGEQAGTMTIEAFLDFIKGKIKNKEII